MNKAEFLKEFEVALDGIVMPEVSKELLLNYSSAFDVRIEEGQRESAIAAELGSPVMLARKIRDELRQEELKAQACNPEDLASITSRLGACVIDFISLNFFLFAFAWGLGYLFYFFFGELGDSSFATYFVALVPMIVLLSVIGISDVMEAMILWKTNGYTIGKWVLKIRVEKKDGTKISFPDALLREVIVKGLASSFTAEILNMLSFFWACITPEKKTMHDLATSTRVVKAYKERRG